MEKNSYQNIKGLDKTYLIGMGIFILICTLIFSVILIIFRILFINHPIIRFSVINLYLVILFIISILTFILLLSLITVAIPLLTIKYTLFSPYRIDINNDKVIIYKFFHKREFFKKDIKLFVEKKDIYIITDSHKYKYYHINRDIISILKQNIVTE